MATNTAVGSSESEPTTCRRSTGTGGIAGGVYGLGFVGAVIYFIQHAAGFWDGVLGVLKACVWPAIVVYKLLGFLGL
jgi:hypothetical protein